jgi:hypothetical protein
MKRVLAPALTVVMLAATGLLVTASPAAARKPTVRSVGSVSCGAPSRGKVKVAPPWRATPAFGTRTLTWKLKLACSGTTGTSTVLFAAKATATSTTSGAGTCSVLGAETPRSTVMDIKWSARGREKLANTRIVFSTLTGPASSAGLRLPGPSGVATVAGSYEGNEATVRAPLTESPAALLSACNAKRGLKKLQTTQAMMLTLGPATSGEGESGLIGRGELQSPVSGGPGDVVVLTGAQLDAVGRVGFERLDVAAARSGNVAALVPPSTLPSSPTSAGGALAASAVDVRSDRLIVTLPPQVSRDVPYAFWVERNHRWVGRAERINDARPLWITPERVSAGQPVELTIVGRNLAPVSAGHTTVRFSSSSFSTDVIAEDAPGGSIDDYTARVTTTLPEGVYDVTVDRGDGLFVGLDVDAGILDGGAGPQRLVVDPSPSVPATVTLSGDGCDPAPNNDDTECLRRAFAALQSGEELVIPGGVWNVTMVSRAADTLVLPPGTALRGDPNDRPLIEYEYDEAATENAWPLVQAASGTAISGLEFRELHYDRSRETRSAIRLWDADGSNGINNVTITDNRFSGMYKAIIGRDAYVQRRIRIEDNVIHAQRLGIALGDVIGGAILNNEILPGDWVPPGQVSVDANDGTQAISIRGARRLLLDGNRMAPTETGQLPPPRAVEPLEPAPNPNGFRAGIFFPSGFSHEMMLVSRNRFECAGTQTGDGEAISVDSNLAPNSVPRRVTAATSASVLVAGPLATDATRKDDWAIITSGTGVGQARRVTSISADRQQVTVNPPFDVAPDTTSWLEITPAHWQTHIVDNVITNEGCPTKPIGRCTAGIVFSYEVALVDRDLAGNLLTDTSGITDYARRSAAPTPNTGGAYHERWLDNIVDGTFGVDDPGEIGADCGPATTRPNYGALELRYDVKPATAGAAFGAESDDTPPVQFYVVQLHGNTVCASTSIGGSVALNALAPYPSNDGALDVRITGNILPSAYGGVVWDVNAARDIVTAPNTTPATCPSPLTP